jgi:CRISPR-associated protein Cas2
MVIVILRNVPARCSGFLASCMLEIAPGVFISPHLSARVREQVWSVISDWFQQLGGSTILMAWKDASKPAGIAILSAGIPVREFWQVNGLYLTQRPYLAADKKKQDNFSLFIPPKQLS